MRILIFNFFSGVMERGIPIYCKNLRGALEIEGHQVVELRCPVFARHFPKPVLNLLFVLFEQLLMPVLSLFFSRSIYPYNGMSVLGSLHSGSLLVVHDFIPNRLRDKSLVARYIRLTQRAHAMLGRDVAYVSTATSSIGHKINAFRKSRQFILPNAFWTFQAATQAMSFDSEEAVLLCTGVGRNKDLPGALDLYAGYLASRAIPIVLLGLAGDTTITNKWLAENPQIDSHLIRVLPKLTDSEVVATYMKARWVWVHSRREGYGRSIAEAKCCAKYVLASNIPPFREQRDNTVVLYSDIQSFGDAVSKIESLDLSVLRPQEPTDHARLSENICLWLS